jgi:hypothetical protein
MGFSALAAATVATGVYTANKSSNAAKDAAQTQANAATDSAKLQQQMMQPWIDAGKVGLDQLQQLTSPTSKLMQGFSMADAQNSEAMKTALQQGKLAIDNSAAAKGGLLSSNNVQDNVKYAEQTAATYENQAFNQWLAQNQIQLGSVESLAQTGQTTSQNVADATSNLMLSGANSIAAGKIGSANAQVGGINSTLNTLGQLFGYNTGANTSVLSPGSVTTVGTGDPYLDTSGQTYQIPDLNMSDRRLKKNIKRLGTTEGGTPIYRYQMKGSNKTQIGVMAQDVEKKQPEAVVKTRQGYKMVDYSKVH